VRRPLPEGIAENPFAAVRAACARVAARAHHVRIDEESLDRTASELPKGELHAEPSAVAVPEGLVPEERTGFILVLDAVNFGSGYFPHLCKRPGLSGYRTIEASLREWWKDKGPLSLEWLRRADATRCAAVFGQSMGDPVVAEVMGLFAESWQELARFVDERHGGELVGPARSARGSAASLVRDLCDMPLYRDVASYEGELVPLLKRAQITVHDLALSVPGALGTFRDLDQLTIFADNLVPHVLRLAGILEFAPELIRRIENGELLTAGSPEEVEIRACAVHAAERLCQKLGARGKTVAPRELDQWLWRRGQEAAYKAHPRHRTRTVFY
jgi:hypothetical protein